MEDRIPLSYRPLQVQSHALRITNAPASFPHFINEILCEYLDVFCTPFIDDILVDLATIEQHRIQARLVLQKAGLYLKPEKWEFHVQVTKYLGLIIASKGISMDLAKVPTVREWAPQLR